MNRKCLTTLALFVAMNLTAQNVDFWDYSTASNGDGLRDVTNIGTLGTAWNFNTTSQGDTVAGGVFQISGSNGDGSGGSPNSFTRKATLGVAQSLDTLGGDTDRFRFEVDFQSWDTSTMSDGDSVSWKLNGPSSNTFAQIVFEKENSTTTRFRWSTSTTGGSFFRNDDIVATSGGPVSYAIEFDLGGLVTYYRDDTIAHVSTDNFNETTYSEALFVNGSESAATSFVVAQVNSFGFSVVPESSAFGLIAGIFSAVLVLIRRR